MRYLTLTAAVAAAIPVIALAACGSSGPSVAARQLAAEKQTCQVLKGAAALEGQGAGFTPIAQVQVLVSQAKPGVMSPQFTRDVRAVTKASYEPSPSEVAALAADCASLGVKGQIWPSNLTDNGN